MRKYISHSGFTLIEVLVGILIVTIVMVAGFQALSAVGVAKIKIIESTEVQKQGYFAAEKFFDMVKRGGTIDYEEYWNRYSYSESFSAGHFELPSGFGNFGNNGSIGSNTYGDTLYECRSELGDDMGENGCLESYNSLGINQVIQRQQQRFGQYEKQFIDRNSDFDSDGGIFGDEDRDGNIIGDDDDLFIGKGPNALPDNGQVGEIYLINALGDERTYFRWNVVDDNPRYMPTGAVCDYISDPSQPTGEACLGTIEFLKLVGKDWGNDHDVGVSDTDGSQSDGIIDTWLVHKDFAGTLDYSASNSIVAGANLDNYWQSIFPDTIHVKSAKFYAYPKKSIEYSWRDSDPSIQVAPYLGVQLEITPSWKQKRKIRGSVPSVTINTTIELLQFDIR